MVLRDGVVAAWKVLLIVVCIGLSAAVIFTVIRDVGNSSAPRADENPPAVAPEGLQAKCIDACSQRFERTRTDWRHYCATSNAMKCNSIDGPRDWSVDFKAVNDRTACQCRIDADTSTIW